MYITNNHIGLIIAGTIVLIVIILQTISFLKTQRKVRELNCLFNHVVDFALKETSITPSILRNKNELLHFIKNIPNRHIKEEDDDDHEEYSDLSLITYPQTKQLNSRMQVIIDSTNEYLCKNIGTSADLAILEDICDNQKSALEDEIHNSLNTPLYLGLAGTFIGIIIGLSGINFQDMFGSSATELTGLQHLLYGIIGAMSASLLGLVFTIFNSALSYKTAITRANEGKGHYMDFLRRELMPVLSNSMSSSLNSLKGVLGHFVDKFGRNLDNYANSAELLNDNLEKQHLVLEELNQLSLTRTANQIARTFMQLRESSDQLSVFKEYQQDLNTTMSRVSGAVSQIQDLMTKFDDFAAGLSCIVQNQQRTIELQNTFQEAITTHFPTGSEGRDIWRKEYDMLVSDGKKVYDSLSDQLTASTEHIRNFLTNNNEFFDTFANMKNVLETMVNYTQVQADCYKDLKVEISSLRKDYKDAQQESIDLHKATLKAIDEMTASIKDIKKTNHAAERV